MNLKRRSTISASIVCLALLVATATVGAATINGTAGNDTLRGGAEADKLNGRAGNDRLYGGAGNDALVGGGGNDLLVGGPGADKLSCGAGKDMARGDADDTIAKDCEKVTGVPTTPPAPPAPPAPPPVSPVTAGQYQGQTQNGNYVFLTVQPNRTFTAFRINDLPEPCNGGLSIVGGVNFGTTTIPIEDNGAFTASGSWDGNDVQGDATWTHWDVTLTGRFDTATSVSGTVALNERLTYKGTAYQCSSGEIRWTATLRP